MQLNRTRRQRYARQLALPELGTAGQARLLAGRVLIVGLGGLGSPAALYLAAAGVGCLGLMDADTEELGNLQRQLIHGVADLGRLKVKSAAATLRALDPSIRLRLHPWRLTAAKAARVLAGYDFIIDATDNFPSKFLIAAACHAAGKPYSHAGIREFIGQTLTVIPGRTTCYSCIFEPPSSAEVPAPPGGPMGFVPGVLGTIQAAEAILYLAKIGTLLTNRVLIFDALALTFRSVAVQRNIHCPLCGLARQPRGTDGGRTMRRAAIQTSTRLAK